MEPTAPLTPVVVDLALVNRSPAEVLLHDHTSFWQPPQVWVGGGRSCRAAVRDAARRWWELSDPRVAESVGTPWSRTPEITRHSGVERRLLLVLLPPGAPRPHTGPAVTPASWWPITRLLAGDVITRPAELPAFLDGYLNGWLPDGQHALNW
ncbi:hypothetical protein [Streptomyces anulatus]|uniref:hypothetical protein n=1 Tax=Streptomyces anulatus TaxID=1892 RepID=UPI003870983E|nr:hypothetical protein OG391_32385 [Streptomyces anulatus]